MPNDGGVVAVRIHRCLSVDDGIHERCEASTSSFDVEFLLGDLVWVKFSLTVLQSVLPAEPSFDTGDDHVEEVHVEVLAGDDHVAWYLALPDPSVRRSPHDHSSGRVVFLDVSRQRFKNPTVYGSVF